MSQRKGTARVTNQETTTERTKHFAVAAPLRDEATLSVQRQDYVMDSLGRVLSVHDHPSIVLVTQSEFVKLVPEHASLVQVIPEAIDLLVMRKRCQEILKKHRLVVTLERILQVACDGERILPQYLIEWANHDRDDDTQIIGISRIIK